MHIELDDESEEEEDEELFDANCNTKMDRRGYMRRCKDGMTNETLENDGWTRTSTTGRNSYIYKRRHWVLKIVKHNITRNTFCASASTLVDSIRLLCDNMGSLAPRVRNVRICNWNREPTLVLLMRDEGNTHVALPAVTERQIRSTVRRLVTSGIMSRDIVTDTARINTGNLVFRLSPKARILTVRFLDVDVPENFMDTRHVPRETLERIWDTVVRACLKRTHSPIAYGDLSTLDSTWTPLFAQVV